ncbi:MAG: hypothetical protein NC548_15560 [Lachnospiraceae bacterium]|nr:hypothetical protein [Lachnospiraceae bacterium]
MEFDIIATIEIETIRYEYILKNGKRDIDENDSIKEILSFKFNSEALEQILFRTGDPVLFVDDKEMYFRYKDNKLVAIHFENKKNIWIVTSYKKFMENCKQIYSKLKMLEIMSKIDIISTPIQPSNNTILDEFELPSGAKIVKRDNLDRDDYFDN